MKYRTKRIPSGTEEFQRRIRALGKTKGRVLHGQGNKRLEKEWCSLHLMSVRGSNNEEEEGKDQNANLEYFSLCLVSFCLSLLSFILQFCSYATLFFYCESEKIRILKDEKQDEGQREEEGPFTAGTFKVMS